MQNISRPGRATQSPIPKKHVTTPCDRFMDARPWQFSGSGRKFRIQEERLRRLLRVLCKYDRTGRCVEVRPSIGGVPDRAQSQHCVLARLRERELNYPERPTWRVVCPWRFRLTWSRRNVFRYLSLAVKRGLISNCELTPNFTRRRELHPERLLFSPRESGTRRVANLAHPPHCESGIRFKSLDSKKLHTAVQNHHFSEKTHQTKSDDDRTVFEKDFSKATPKSQPKPPVQETAAKGLPLALRSWMDARILSRARAVRSPGAYLRASRPGFLDDMVEEVELYLMERVMAFMERQIQESSVVNGKEVFDLLVEQTEKHQLPVGIDGEECEDQIDVYGRLHENAAQILGLVGSENGEQLFAGNVAFRVGGLQFETS